MFEIECPRCGRDIEFRVSLDWEGDPSVPGGTRHFRTVEPVDKPCTCDLSDEEWDALEARALDAEANWSPSYDEY